MWGTDSTLSHSENIMGSCFDAGVGVQIKCLHYYPVFLSNERDILRIIMLCGNIKIFEIKKITTMVWPIIWLNSAIVRYFKLKCKILFLFKDNTLPFGLCCKIFKGWRWTGSVWRHLFKKLKPPLTSGWLQAWDWRLQDKFGKSHHANEQGSFQKLLNVWQTDSGIKEDEPYLSKDRGDLSINKDNNKNKRLKHTQES